MKREDSGTVDHPHIRWPRDIEQVLQDIPMSHYVLLAQGNPLFGRRWHPEFRHESVIQFCICFLDIGMVVCRCCQGVFLLKESPGMPI